MKVKTFIKILKKKFSVNYRFNSGFVKIPHYSKKAKGGEDALAIKEGMICVADGVGGWNESGVDPSKYSRELCENISNEYLNNYHKHHNNPKMLFSEAAKVTTAIGSSTFCMCVLDIEKKLIHTVNLGDSGFMILHLDNENYTNPSLNKILKYENNVNLIYKSEEQTHSFNYPYQVGTYGDNPEEAVTKSLEFNENDLIILATDGLWDNLYDNQIISIIKPFFSSNYLPDLNIVAEMIGETCLKYSSDRRYKSPFCMRSGGLYLGGKEDDITIIVSQIVKNI